MNRRLITIIIAGASAIALVGGTAAVTAAVIAPATSTPEPAVTDAASAVNTAGFPTGGPGIFTDRCALTKTAPDDPIMMPGMSGMSMQHDFFGNRAVTASSTAPSLVGGTTTCTTSADASAYWLPVLYQKGKALEPASTLVYWRAPKQTASSVTTMPAGIGIVAGDAGSTMVQNKQIIAWTCTTAPTKAFDIPPACAGGKLRLVVTFPNCWDGKTLDGAAQTNVIYADKKNAACPASHPVQIPQIVMHMVYPTSDAANITLSTGPTQQGSTTTAHADFLNGWTQSVMDADSAACITTGIRCGPVSGDLASPKGGKVAADRKKPMTSKG